jgi:hypothetical protein
MKLTTIRPPSGFKMMMRSYKFNNLADNGELTLTKPELDEGFSLPNWICFQSMSGKPLDALGHIYSYPTSAPRQLPDDSGVAHISPDPSFIPPTLLSPTTIPFPSEGGTSPMPPCKSPPIHPGPATLHSPTPSLHSLVTYLHQTAGLHLLLNPI